MEDEIVCINGEQEEPAFAGHHLANTDFEFRSDQNDPRWGKIRPINIGLDFCGQLYSSPQPEMLTLTFFMTVGLEFVVLKFVFYGIHFYIGIFLCLFILYLLFSLGFSNPGVAFAQHEKYQAHRDLRRCTQKCNHRDFQELDRMCSKCNLLVNRNTKHCSMCNVCVMNYDHHCVFIGKCVGGKNLGRFQLFLFMIFGTLIYGLVSTLMTLDHVKTLRKH